MTGNRAHDSGGGDGDGDGRGGDGDWQAVWHHLHETLGGKWSFHVLRLLADRDAGFNEVKRELDGVTSKTLAERLRELRCRGFVARDVLATTPPSTRYSLTDRGERFVSVLCELESLVELVDCDGCDDSDCELLTVDAETTAAVLPELC